MMRLFALTTASENDRCSKAFEDNGGDVCTVFDDDVERRISKDQSFRETNILHRSSIVKAKS
jgi:uncharacterized protein YkuJ